MNKLESFLRSQDGYGQRVSLTMRGEETYKSVFGGIITTFGRLILVYYLINSCIELSNYKNEYQRQAWSNDVIINPTELVLEVENFQAAVSYYFLREDWKQIEFNRYFRF